MRPSSARRPLIWLLVAASLVSGCVWIALIPPFEGPDESAFYKELVNDAHGGSRGGGLPLYPVVMKAPVRLAAGPGGDVRPFEARYNPSFRFISNKWARVNMFMHGRASGMRRADVSRMYVLRATTALMWIASLLLVFETARLFFGRADLAFLTAVLCLSLPQFTFFSSVLHQESTSMLVAAVAYWVLMARLFGRVNRWTLWAVALATLALAPLSDRQGFFVLLLVPAGLLLIEDTWRGRAIAAAVLAAPAAALLLLPQFASLRTDIRVTGFGMFSSVYRGGYWNADNPQYLAFEFLPKMFFGFIGWLGAPSILLPPAVYAGVGAVMLIAVTGLFLTRDREPLSRPQRRAAVLMALGVLFMVAPIVYANILISRNSWYGRWLFPSIAPMMIGLVFGFRSFVARARTRPRAAATALVAAAAVLELMWLTAPGDALRAAIVRHHYGDKPRTIATVAALIVAIGIAGVLTAIAPLVARRFPRIRGGPMTIAAAAWVANLVVLVTFIAPLYTPIEASDLAALIREELAEGEDGRASALYRIGVAVYPSSTEVRSLATEHPMLLLAGADDLLLGDLQARIGRGERLDTRRELMTLARIVRIKGWGEPALLREVVANAGSHDPGVAEARALLRVELEGRNDDPNAGSEVLRAGLGREIKPTVHDEIFLEGYTVATDLSGYRTITVYFRPLRVWSRRQLYLQAYRPGSTELLHLTPESPPFGGWKRPELAWETFLAPATGEFDLFLGVQVGGSFGDVVALGRL